VPPHARKWRTWSLRTVPDAQRKALADALSELSDARDRARQRLAHLEELTELITRAAASGALTTNPTDNPTKGR